MKNHLPDINRYDGRMVYSRCGNSGLKLPRIALGLWQNFGNDTSRANQQEIIHRAFDCGITYFDLANNYGPPPGAAEERFGRILRLLPRHELVISTKAGYDMWPGPYGEWNSRKHLLTSIDHSLRRMKLEYVDIFYSHRFDQNTPLEETLSALNYIVESGKALYVGISSYDALVTAQAIEICRRHRWSPILVHQVNYSLLNQWAEYHLFDSVIDWGMGVVAFCPLYQGLLSERFLTDQTVKPRATMPSWVLESGFVRKDILRALKQLREIARARGQTLSQLALSWVLRSDSVTCALAGASRVGHILDNATVVHQTNFSTEELMRIQQIVAPLNRPQGCDREYWTSW